MKLHIVKEGDTLQSLSEKYTVDVEQLLAANPHIEDMNRVEPGAKVKIPTGPVTMQNVEPSVQPAAVLPKVEKAAVAPKTVQPAAVAPKAVLPAAQQPMPLPIPLPSPAPMPNPNVGMAAAAPKGKLESQQANLSPLNVKWTGMTEQPAHPFAQFPTPAVPAGAYGPPPMPHFVETGGSDYGPPYGYTYGPGTQPAYMSPPGPMPLYGPGPMPLYGPGSMPPYGPGSMPPYMHGFEPFGVQPGMPAYHHDCGCGAPAHRPYLPYALPMVTSARAGYSDPGTAGLAAASETGATDRSEPERAGGPANDKRKVKNRKHAEKVKISSRTDKVKAFLKRSKSKRKTYRYGSKPWVRD